MTEGEKSLDSIRANKETQIIKGKSKLISPEPFRKKFLAELMHAFTNRKITFAELVRMKPKKIRQIAEVGFVKLRHGRYQEARKVFEVLCFIDHKNYFHHLALAGAYQHLKLDVDALFQYTEALKYDSGNINALVNRGEIYLRKKLYRKAAEDFREAILLDKSGQDRYANRARSLVVAIKRSIEKDKALKAAKDRGELPPKKKYISPLNLITRR